MKNIERPEVISLISKVITSHNCNEYECIKCPLFDIHKSICARKSYKAMKWLNSEYVEPHHWEQWELEFLKHTNKKYLWVAISGNSYVWLYTDKPHKSVSTDNYIGQSYTDTQTKFDTLKQDEVINIDEELERNGMHR